MATPVILSIDQGTTSSRAMLFSHQGVPLANAQKEFTCNYPEDGWVEQKPEDLWQSVVSVCQSVIEKASDLSYLITAIGITNQRETTIIWDRKSGQPIYPAIVWQDRRTGDYCKTLKQAGSEASVREKTGLLLDPYFSATKIVWILDNVPSARDKAMRGELAFGTVDSFLINRMSGGVSHVTDITNASRTMLFNIHTLDWDDDLLALFNIPRSLLPTVLPCDAHFCDTKLFGISAPVKGVAGDQQAAAFGQGCYAAGESKATYGTGCFLLMNVGTEAPTPIDGLLTTIGFQLGNQGNTCNYALEGSIFNAGTAVQFLRDQLGIIKSAGEIESLASSVDDSMGVYLVPAFTGLGAPYWDPNARGIICGLSRASSQAHLARAVIDSVAFQTNDIQVLFNNSATSPKLLNVDGGMTVNWLVMQTISNLANLPVRIAAIPETTALGAAFLSMIGSGVASSPSQLSTMIKYSHECTPQLASDTRTSMLEGWKKAIASTRAFSSSA